MSPSRAPTLSALVRFAYECEALALWLKGRCDERLVEAAEAADRRDWRACFLLADATTGLHAGDAARAVLVRDFVATCASVAAGYAVVVAAREGPGLCDAAEQLCASRARELLLPDAPDAASLRLAVAEHIEAHPELHDQGRWGDGSDDPACKTPCCVAGWTCHLGGGSRGLSVPLAAAALLYLDGAPLPDFAGHAARDDILRALRAIP